MSSNNRTPTRKHAQGNDTSTTMESSSDQSSFMTPFGFSNQSNDISETYLTPNAMAANESTITSSLIELKREDILKCFLRSKITLLKIRSNQSKKQEKSSQNVIISLLQNKPSWHLHLLLRAYCIPFHCYNVN